ncbi:MAG: ring-cleaving dioxygenase [Thermoproteota archaeon]|nr:ring-cleaving dioxygenase [Thermoproteota archaeon]
MDKNGSHQGILGVHHVTAIAGDPQKNINFYTGFLGLRLVKLTVNFDDPSTYHLYYGDESGRPGTILTFFPWQGLPQGHSGTGQVVTTSFLVPENALEYWVDRLKEHKIKFSGPTPRFENNEQVIKFNDPGGMELELVAHNAAEERKHYVWNSGPIPEAYAARGFYSVTLCLEGYERTASILTENLGFSGPKHDGNRFRFEIDGQEATAPGDNGSGSNTSNTFTSVVDIVCLPYAQRASMGVGSVHHVAWRTPTDESQYEVRRKIIEAGLNATPVIDRTYFHSVYFREPGGVLFEIATDPPGFTVDQNLADLGQKLQLPKWLEPDRDRLEKTLPNLRLPTIDQFSKNKK